MAIKSDVTDLKSNFTNSTLTLQETQKRIGDLESPLAIRFKGITITPGGFLAAESVYRNRALGADINTPFNSVNMPGAGQNAISEFLDPAVSRESRCSPRASSATPNLPATWRADFFESGITSNNNQSGTATPCVSGRLGGRLPSATDGASQAVRCGAW